MPKIPVLVATALLAITVQWPAGAAVLTTPDIAYTRMQLPNGLTLIVHEDHKAPIVALSVYYHVGSKNEPQGRSGFAHLFEHLMFQGSENHADEYFLPFELVGATDMNGTTWLDRTNYFETVPTTALDMALWMESDRMGHLLGAIGQKQLDEQRGVVQNEKRQGENQPYGRVFTILQANVFPANHPYHHTTIGSMQDLNAAALNDVKNWFREYYGAANATIVLAGDITPAQARAKVMRYFSDIAAGPRLRRPQPWVAARTVSSRVVMPDKVPLVRIYRAWNVPQLGTTDLLRLQLAARALGGGKTSRLYQRLVYRDKLANRVSAGTMAFEMASMFLIQVDVRKGIDPLRVEAALNDELAHFLKQGPNQDELQRARMGALASFTRGIEKVGGFAGKAKVLAEGQVYRQDPGAYRKDFVILNTATPGQVRSTAKRWLGQGDFTLVVEPNPDVQAAATAYAKLQKGLPAARTGVTFIADPVASYQTGARSVNRGQGVPIVTRFPDLSFPILQRVRLANGIPVVLAERHAVPLVQVELLFDGGYAADQGHKLGTSRFAMSMLDEGTSSMDSVQLAQRLERLGARLRTGSSLDASTIYLSTLQSELQPALQLLADVARNPAFRQVDIERVRQQVLARIAQEQARPVSMALRTLPPLLYGKGHPYAIPFTGSGTEASVKAMRRGDLLAYQAAVLRPDNVQILISGDTTLAKILPQLERAFSSWEVHSQVPLHKQLTKVKRPAVPRVFLIDHPGSAQSIIFAGVLAPSTRDSRSLAIDTMNQAFGGSFTSRLNMNLREDKHWAYGSFSFAQNAQGQRLFVLYAPVQTDKTAASVAELLRESRELIGKRPLSTAEIEKVKLSQIRSLPGDYETGADVLSAMAGIVQYGRADDYVQNLRRNIQALDDGSIQAAVREVVQPSHYTWVIVGDLSKIEKPVRKLGLGEVKVIDTSGRVLR